MRRGQDVPDHPQGVVQEQAEAALEDDRLRPAADQAPERNTA